MNDLARFLAGGAAGRADSLSGLNPDFQNALAQFFAGAPGGVTINSAYRSPDLQRQLWESALQRYGSEAEARRWVAPPGRSQHNHGMAVDLGYADDEARQWAHENAARFGLAFPLSNEDWHLELASARSGAPASSQNAPPSDQGQPGQNALAALFVQAEAPRDAPEQSNRLRTLQLDPEAFRATPYAMPEPIALQQRQRFATRYLRG